MAYLYDLTDTWNAAGTVFNAIKMNVTNTASAAGSKIVSLQVGATDRFTVDKDGNGYFSGTLQAVGSISSPNTYISGNSGTIGMQDNSASILAYNATGSGGITNTLRFITGAAERVRINGSGNVGIGTATPANRLQVSYTSTAPSLSSDAGSGISLVGSSTLRVNIGSDPSSPFSGWVQASNGSGSAFPLSLNPLGGNVGVGTSSPGYKLTVAGTGGSATMSLLETGVRSWGIRAGGATTNTFDIADFTAGTSRLLIDSSGNVGIGTSSPGAKLDVVGDAYFGQIITTGSGVSTGGVRIEVGGNRTGDGASYIDLHATNATDYETRFIRSAGTNGNFEIQNLGTGTFTLNASGATSMLFNTNGSERMRITSSGDVGIGTSSPGAKLDVRTGYILAGTGSSTEGTKILGGYYTSGSLTTFGSERSNGGPVIGYGVWPSTVAEASFVSATSINVARGAYTIVGNVHKWFAGGAQTVAVDSAVSTSEVMRIDPSGNLGIGTSSPSSKFVVSNGGAAGFEINPIGSASAPALYSYNRNTNAYDILTTLASEVRWQTGSSPSERMRIDSSGNVGIGQTSPSWGRLEVASGSTNKIRLYNTTGNGNTIDFLDQSWQSQIVGSAGNLLFNTGGTTERARIDSSGNLLVGTTALSSVEKMSVVTTGDKQAGLFKNDSATRDTIVAWNAATADNNQFITFYTETSITARGSITYNRGSGVVAYNTTSDARLKENIADADNASSLIDQIKVRQFDWRESGSHQRYGFVAQELLEVAPEAVSVPADEDQMMGVDYSKLVPMMLKEIQSLRARVAQLEGN